MHRFHLPCCRSLFLPSLGLISSLFVGHANLAVAAILYGQTSPSEPTAAFASADFAIAQKSADNFLITGTEPVTVRSLRFIGGSGVDSAPTDDFRVVFLEDIGGIPGAPILGGDYNIGPAYSRQPTGGPTFGSRHPDGSGGIPPQEYIINLPEGITANPGTTYWLSITNTRLPNFGWVWARADGELDQTTAAAQGNASIESGPWNTFVTGGMWFELNDHIVPEPSSLLILLSCFVATASRRPGNVVKTPMYSRA
jgi:hypothetical protein